MGASQTSQQFVKLIKGVCLTIKRVYVWWWFVKWLLALCHLSEKFSIWMTLIVCLKFKLDDQQLTHIKVTSKKHKLENYEKCNVMKD